MLFLSCPADVLPVLLRAAAADAPTLLLSETRDEDTGVPACVNCPV